MTTARIYIRISSTDEEPIRVNQERDARDFVAKNGWRLAKVYSEVASAGSQDRPKFQELLTDLLPGEIVVFKALARMTREGAEAAFDLLRRLRDQGNPYKFLEQPHLDYDPAIASDPYRKMTYDIALTVQAAQDEAYRAVSRKSTKKAFESGRHPTWGKPREGPWDDIDPNTKEVIHKPGFRGPDKISSNPNRQPGNRIGTGQPVPGRHPKICDRGLDRRPCPKHGGSE